MKRVRVLVEALAAVALVAVVKLVAHALDVEFIELNSLFTSLIGGGIFLFGLVLAGTLADYKESDRMPAEIVSALDSIWEEMRAIAARNPAFQLARGQAALVRVPERLLAEIGAPDFKGTLESVSALTQVFGELEAAGLAPNYVARLKNDQSTLRRLVLRMHHIQRTDFMPSAYNLLKSVVALVLIILVFTTIEPFAVSLIQVSFVAFLFIYVLRLLRLLEQPFRPQGESRDDVSMHLLDEFVSRVGAATA